MHSLVDNFFICGFSGAGKSTLLEELAVTLAADFQLIDSDDFIREHFASNGETLGNYIERVGIEIFRQNELEVIQAFKKTQAIIALGGGALNPLTESALASFKGIWLDTPFELCWERIAMDSNRPLVAKGKERMKELYFDRLPLYQKHIRVQSSIEAIEFIKKHIES